MDRTVWNPYPLIASPRVYPGQILNATLLNGGGTSVRLYLAYYDANDDVQRVYSEAQSVHERADLSFVIPQEAFPAFEIGVETAGTVYLDCLGWSGEPHYNSTRPAGRRSGGSMWRRAWVNGVDDFGDALGRAFSSDSKHRPRFVDSGQSRLA